MFKSSTALILVWHISFILINCYTTRYGVTTCVPDAVPLPEPSHFKNFAWSPTFQASEVVQNYKNISIFYFPEYLTNINYEESLIQYDNSQKCFSENYQSSNPDHINNVRLLVNALQDLESISNQAYNSYNPIWPVLR